MAPNGGNQPIEKISQQEAIENLEIGGRNYVLGSGLENSSTGDLIARYALSEPITAGEEYALSLSIDAAKAGYGASSSKTVFLRKANYQNYIESGITGYGYAGDELGTFDGSFYGNTTSYYITGSLFNQMAAYIAQGNNAFTIYNPYPSSSSQGYSYNYLQWSSVVITVTYEEAVSQPTTSASSVNLGSAVTIYTNRQSTGTTHTLGVIREAVSHLK